MNLKEFAREVIKERQRMIEEELDFRFSYLEAACGNVYYALPDGLDTGDGNDKYIVPWTEFLKENDKSLRKDTVDDILELAGNGDFGWFEEGTFVRGKTEEDLFRRTVELINKFNLWEDISKTFRGEDWVLFFKNEGEYKAEVR